MSFSTVKTINLNVQYCQIHDKLVYLLIAMVFILICAQLSFLCINYKVLKKESCSQKGLVQFANLQNKLFPL